MLVAAGLLFWGWWFWALSALCFLAFSLYMSCVRMCGQVILQCCGFKQTSCKGTAFRRQGSRSQASTLVRAATLNLPKPAPQSQLAYPTLPQKSSFWFHLAAYEPSSSTICHLSPLSTASTSRSTTSAACAAAAAAMAVFGGSVGQSVDAIVAAVGAAALFARHFAQSDPGSIVIRSNRISSGCSVPPVEYEASDEEKQELESRAPSDFLCPLGRVLMTDPVCTPSGFTYQRSCLENFLVQIGHDPARASPLISSQLYPNILIRDQVAAWLQKQGVCT